MSVIKHKIFLIYILFLALLATGCGDEDLFLTGNGDGSDELPVSITAMIEEEGHTRAAIPQVKKSFAKEDVIQVSAEFTLEDGTTERRYGAFKFDGTSKWNPVEKTLTWPNTATSGKFYAYFVRTVTQNLKPGSKTTNFLLSSLTSSTSFTANDKTYTDPMYAPETEVPQYGGGVNFRFSHLCTYLTLDELPNLRNPQTEYWFIGTSVKELNNQTTPKAFNNAYYLELSADNQLSFHFTQQADNNYHAPGSSEGLVYISGAPTIVETGSGDNATEVTSVSYFLEPGFYDKFELVNPTIDSYYEYLKYDYSSLSGGGAATGSDIVPPALAAGCTYTMNTTVAPGVIVTIPAVTEPEGWDDNGSYYNIDVEAFLRAVYAREDYYNEENTQILRREEGGVKLLHNVDFRFAEYTFFGNDLFSPDVAGTTVFDGGHHYISHLGCPLFRRVSGTVQNLGINQVKADIISKETPLTSENRDKDTDLSRSGAVCRYNTGHIDNIRVTGGVDFKVGISVDSEIENDQQAHNVGLIVGENRGEISNIWLSGPINLSTFNASQTSSDIEDATVFFGGMVGQNAGSAKITYIQSLDEPGFDAPDLTLTNSCVGKKAAYYVGGVVGFSTATMEVAEITLRSITINCSRSKGLSSFVGLVGGEMNVDGNMGQLLNCVFNGSASAGMTSGAEGSSGDCVNYLGGLTGALRGVRISNCMVGIGTLTAGTGDNGTIFGTGGAFGRIREGTDTSKIMNINVAGNRPNGNGKTYGAFAGIVPLNVSWNASFSNNNIYISFVSAGDYIGQNMNQ